MATRNPTPPQSEQPRRGVLSQRNPGQRSYPYNQKNVNAVRAGTLGKPTSPPKSEQSGRGGFNLSAAAKRRLARKT